METEEPCRYREIVVENCLFGGVVEWGKGEDQVVILGEKVATLRSSTGDVLELEAPCDGRLKVFVEHGQNAEPGQVVGRVEFVHFSLISRSLSAYGRYIVKVIEPIGGLDGVEADDLAAALADEYNRMERIGYEVVNVIPLHKESVTREKADADASFRAADIMGNTSLDEFRGSAKFDLPLGHSVTRGFFVVGRRRPVTLVTPPYERLPFSMEHVREHM